MICMEVIFTQDFVGAEAIISQCNVIVKKQGWWKNYGTEKVSYV